jgi:hypothetical protein
MNEGMQICQAYLGAPKIHRAKDYFMELSAFFRQLVSTMFFMMNEFSTEWSQTKWSKPTAIFGFDEGEILLPPECIVSREKLFYKFKTGFADNWDTFKSILAAENFQKLREIASLEMDFFEMPANLWARILFDFSISFKNKSCERTRLLELLFKLYQGMVLSYANKTAAMSNLQAQEVVEEICLHMEQTKPYIVDRWNK